MEEYCKKCGCKMYRTNLGRWFCPNCGIQDEELKSELKDEEVEYVG